jgi:hypothetical protein
LGERAPEQRDDDEQLLTQRAVREFLGGSAICGFGDIASQAKPADARPALPKKPTKQKEIVMTKSTSTPEEKRLERVRRKYIADMIEGVATGDVPRFSSAFYDTMGNDDGEAVWRAAFRGIAELTSVPASPIQAYFEQEIVGVDMAGEGYLEEVLGSDLLIAAYRKLLTPYFGSLHGPNTLKLYCVMTKANYGACCYTIHWYDQIDEVQADWEGWYLLPGGIDRRNKLHLRNEQLRDDDFDAHHCPVAFWNRDSATAALNDGNIGGAVLVETLAPAEAIISRYVVRHTAYPHVNTGELVVKKNEVKFVVDPRRLTDVTVVKHLSREDFITSPPS